MIIEDVIYGVILKANKVISENEPPVNASKISRAPSALLLRFAYHSWNFAISTPGRGSVDPIRITTSIARVKNNLFLTSFTFNAFTNVLNIRSPQLFHLKLQSFPLLLH